MSIILFVLIWRASSIISSLCCLSASVEGADFSPHLPRQPSFQRNQRHMGVEGDFAQLKI